MVTLASGNNSATVTVSQNNCEDAIGADGMVTPETTGEPVKKLLLAPVNAKSLNVPLYAFSVASITVNSVVLSIPPLP